MFTLREYLGVLAGVLLLPVVETSNEDLVALLDFHSHFPGNVDSLVIEVSVEAQELGSVMIDEFQGVVDSEFFA